MSKVLDELLALLSLEAIEKGIYRGQSQDLGFGAVFGGQVIGQALSAAKETIPEDRHVHSFHCYFLRAGDAQKPIVYDVQQVRDGRSFHMRRVEAIQHGQSIFYMTASFQVDEEGLEHQAEMPSVPPPEELMSELEIARKYQERIPAHIREQITCDKPIEMKPVKFHNPLNPKPMEPVRHIWFRTNGKLPDNPIVHRYLLAYASDFNFLPTATQPHGISFMSPRMKMASLDHAMWFHRDFRFDDWLLYSIDSPSASGARGLVRGQFFTRDGKLVASTTQEGLIRLRPEKS
ncbi:MAG: acyl-CoA thioesterase II [Deltaproteobacteria bacterium]|nr:acyl-CoA thioesterase II [Deltaproteobacteria bacterium]|tara:strand:+ start:3317 stop:4186 length:870 start_codon:yes stop_codon:yes gene_type:complete